MVSLFDANAVLESLAVKRKVFHSEADLQFAFAWTTKTLYPHFEVRLETHPTQSESLDLALVNPITKVGIAVEFKYKTQSWKGTCDGEEYALKDQGASDIGFYDIVKDITRVERFIDGQMGWIGYVITLTNVPRYWNLPNREGTSNASAFRVSHGLTLNGTRQWGPNTGGTNKGREPALQLRGTYELHWRDYSRISENSAGYFRALVIPIN